MNPADEILLKARERVLMHFHWIAGDADTWTMLRDADSLQSITAGLAALVESEYVDVIVGVEARGLVLAPLVAQRNGVGFSPVRKKGALFPGQVIEAESAPDYRGNTHTLQLRSDHLAGVRVVLVDDWIETGSTAETVAGMLARIGATLVSVVVIVDEASGAVREFLPEVRSLVRASDLS